jgi:hypothetical protein
MKTVLLLTLILLLGVTMTIAQGYNGAIGIFADPGGNSVYLSGAPGVRTYYFLHVNAVGATASQWAAPHPSCMTATRLADVPVFAINLGNTETGVTIGYGACKTGSFHIMTVMYQVTAATDCCFWSVVADPNLPSGRIEIPDCEFNLTYGSGGQGIINPNPTCTGPIEDTTWGGVKALYSE